MLNKTLVNGDGELKERMREKQSSKKMYGENPRKNDKFPSACGNSHYPNQGFHG